MPASKSVRRAIQRSSESLLTLAARYRLNPKTVQKCRNRSGVEDRPRGTPRRGSSLLTAEQEAIAVAMRQRTLLPLDDCLYTLQATMPQLTRSALYRCFQRHGVARLYDRNARHKRYSPRAIGHVLIDRHEIRTREGRFFLFQAIDRTSKLVFAAFDEQGDRRAAARFMRAVIAGLPYQIQTVATEAELPGVAFKALCARRGVTHRFRPSHAWTADQQARMAAALDAASKSYERGASKREVEAAMQSFLSTFNFSRWLKSLGGLTPFQFTCRSFAKAPRKFRADPHHHILQLIANFGAPP